MTLKPLLIALLLTASTTAAAAPTEAALNLCTVAGYYSAPSSPSLFYGIAAKALAAKHPADVAAPECQAASAAGQKVALRAAQNPAAGLSVDDKRIVALVNMFSDQVYANLYANLKGF